MELFDRILLEVARDMLQKAETGKQWAQERAEDLQTQVLGASITELFIMLWGQAG